MRDKISTWIGQLLSIFVDEACVGCGAESQKLICGRCLRGIQRVKSEETCLSYGQYEGIFKKLIYHFKYENRFALAKPLSQLLLELVPAEIDGLIPVPLHIQKLRQRRYNPAALVAKYLSKRLSVPVYIDVLKKTFPSLSQTGLSKTERRKNVENTFRVFNPSLIARKRILLVDDVYTTGATTDECKKELRRHGALRVVVLTLARKM